MISYYMLKQIYCLIEKINTWCIQCLIVQLNFESYPVILHFENVVNILNHTTFMFKKKSHGFRSLFSDWIKIVMENHDSCALKAGKDIKVQFKQDWKKVTKYF